MRCAQAVVGDKNSLFRSNRNCKEGHTIYITVVGDRPKLVNDQSLDRPAIMTPRLMPLIDGLLKLLRFISVNRELIFFYNAVRREHLRRLLSHPGRAGTLGQ